MSLDTVYMGLDAGDFRLQSLDPLPQLLDRHWVEVLFGELDQRIAGFARKKILQVHRQNR